MSGQRQTAWELAKGLAAVWAGLLVLLAISVGSAYVRLCPFNGVFNLLVAAVMVGLLAVFLMNLGRASALVRVFAASGLLWLVFMFILTFTDYLSRG